jgi:hypothetical protein
MHFWLAHSLTLTKGNAMHHLTSYGWQRVHQGFGYELTSRFANENDLWEWAMHQGSAFQLAAYLIIGMLGGCEADFPGFDNVRADSHPMRMAWTLDWDRRAMISDFLADPGLYMS